MNDAAANRWYVRLDPLPELALHLLATHLVSLPDTTRVAEAGSTLWIQTSGSEAEVLPLLRRLPGAIYRELDGDLIRWGASVPELDVQSLGDSSPGTDRATIQWMPLADVCRIELPVPRLAPLDLSGPRQTLRLLRGGVMTDCHVLLTRVNVLRAWVETASQDRIGRLQWAIRGRDCLIMGAPLPPIQGAYFVRRTRVILPAGMTWAPPISSEAVLKLFDIPAHDWLFWESSERWSVIPADAFMTMSRENVRVADGPGLLAEYLQERARS